MWAGGGGRGGRGEGEILSFSKLHIQNLRVVVFVRGKSIVLVR
jgi:hypothetical protein